MSEKKNPPAHTVRLGSIKAAIWPNKAEYGIRHNVTFSRLYKEGDEWRDSASFARDDLLELAKAADMAHTWIREHERRDQGEAQQEGSKG